MRAVEKICGVAGNFGCLACFRIGVPVGETNMRQLTACLAFAVCLALLPAVGSAKGCLKGAAVGGVAGHVAGHHAVVGAAAGCVIEHHREKAKDKAARQNEQAQRAAVANDAAHGPSR
jgi:hypothetical protein